MTTPTNENRDTARRDSDRIDVNRPDADRIAISRPDADRVDRIDSTAPETRHRLDLSMTKIAAGACAAAIAAAVGSKLGVGGTIIGAAVASAVATSASAVIGHSLERGKTAARKAIPPPALTRLDATRIMPSLADRALTDSDVEETVERDRSAHAPTMVLPTVRPEVAADAPRTWKDRVPGRKPLIAAAVASFLIGTGAVTALEVARKGEFPGYHSNVFTNDPGQGSDSNDQPSQENPGGSGTRGTTPSQKPDSPSPTPSGSGNSSPSSIPSTPSSSGSAPSTPSTGSSSDSPAPTTTPTAPTAPTGSANPTTPGTAGPTAPSSSANGLGKATPSGGPTG
jgi:hypothetical protein